jgi:diguanylate cyclase (GGDEF)-like protein
MTALMNVSSLEPQTLLQQIQELRRENAQLRVRAERDGLTGCLRREAMIELLEKRRSFGLLGQQMTVAIADIDFFKKINDTHGHFGGDLALKAFADALHEMLPEGGLACRMGGEEFVLVLPGSCSENAALLEVIRLKIQSLRVQARPGTQIQMTASFGAADWNSDQDLLRACAQADALLYTAKNSGRNRIAA